jgi:hypothetical protein
LSRSDRRNATGYFRERTEDERKDHVGDAACAGTGWSSGAPVFNRQIHHLNLNDISTSASTATF